MPGLFDNPSGPYQGGGILSGLGNFFGGIGAAMNPAIQEGQFRRQAYNALAQQNGPQDASILMGAPEAYGLGFQRQLFLEQLNELQKQNPQMSLGEALFRISEEGRNQQYGARPVPGFKIGPIEAPGTLTGGAIHPPQGFGFGGQPTQSAGVQPQPSQQPAGGSSPALPPAAQTAVQIEAAQAGAKKRAEAEAAAQPGFPGALTTAQRTISRLEGLRDNPNLPLIVGSVYGRTRPLGGEQANLVNETNELQGKIIADTYTQLRSLSGRPVSPGALKELSAGTGDLIGNRTGTLEGYKKSIDNTIAQIKEETEAAWEAAGRPGPKPTFTSSAPAQQQQYPEGTVIVNRQTGERRIMRAGQWSGR